MLISDLQTELNMNSLEWGFIGTLAGTVVGASASILTTVISGRNSVKVQQEADSLGRSERSRAFQRENLLNLQETLILVMRLHAEGHFQLISDSKETGDWKKARFGEPLNTDMMLSLKKLTIETERVADDSLRKELKEFRSSVASIAISGSQEEGFHIMMNVGNTLDDLNEKLGIILRSNY